MLIIGFVTLSNPTIENYKKVPDEKTNLFSNVEYKPQWNQY